MPKLLDLFCGAGGCSVGYARAGYEVIGVDNVAHPDYPYEIIIGDAMEILNDKEFIAQFDVIHASPPCPRYSIITRVSGKQNSHPDLIPVLIEKLNEIGKPWVIENVPGAPMEGAVTVCGSSFDLRVRRHRMFMSNKPLVGTQCDHKKQGRAIGLYGTGPEKYETQLARYARNGRDYGLRAASVADGQDAMGISWMSKWDDLKDAIPPAYTHFIGTQVNNL